jgi:hypothetical protein
MKTEIKTKWVEALRSGKYVQGKGMLRFKDNNFCCLGVLCDIVDSSRWVFTRGTADCYGYDGCHTILPGNIARSTEFPDGHKGTLIHMNDTGVPFSEIANYIEQEL